MYLSIYPLPEIRSGKTRITQTSRDRGFQGERSINLNQKHKSFYYYKKTKTLRQKHLRNSVYLLRSMILFFVMDFSVSQKRLLLWETGALMHECRFRKCWAMNSLELSTPTSSKRRGVRVSAATWHRGRYYYTSVPVQKLHLRTKTRTLSLKVALSKGLQVILGRTEAVFVGITHASDAILKVGSRGRKKQCYRQTIPFYFESQWPRVGHLSASIINN